MLRQIATLMSLLGLLCFLMLPAAAQTHSTYVDVTDYGATPDANGDDDAPAIEAAIAAACSGSNPRAVFFPKGEYVITSTIDIPYGAHSLKLFGTGCRRNGGPSVVKPSQISWNGNAGGTMVNVIGVDGLRLEDIAFNGDYQYNGGRAGIGIDVQYEPGSPSGEFSIQRVGIMYCTVGFQCEGGGCNADMTFIDTYFGHNNTGFHTTNSQNVDYVFIRCEVGYHESVGDTIGFWFEHGSSAVFHELCCGAVAKVIKMDNGDVNGGCLAVYGWKPEMYLVNGLRPQLLDVGGWATVVHISSLCTGISGGEDTTTPIFNLRGSSTVKVDASQIYGSYIASVGDGTGTCLLTFDSCKFGAGAGYDPRSPEAISHDANSGFIMRDCELCGMILNETHTHSMYSCPMAPTLTSVTPGSRQLTLNWTDNSSDETGFSITCWSGSSWSEVGVVGANVTTYTHTGLTPWLTQYYQVRPKNGTKRGVPSNTMSGTPTD